MQHKKDTINPTPGVREHPKTAHEGPNNKLFSGNKGPTPTAPSVALPQKKEPQPPQEKANGHVLRANHASVNPIHSDLQPTSPLQQSGNVPDESETRKSKKRKKKKTDDSNEPQHHIMTQSGEYSHRPHNNYNTIETIKGLSSLIVLIVGAGLIALFVTRFVFQSYVVDGKSMQPTLEDNDRLIIYRAPVTWARVTGSTYTPGRGEVVVLNVPTKREPLIKRVIGLPGERVVIKDGTMTVFNDQNPDGFDVDQLLDLSGVVQDTEGNLDITVAQDTVFVVGDNRGASNDSRNFDEIGNVPTENIIGELVLRIYPLSQAERF